MDYALRTQQTKVHRHIKRLAQTHFMTAYQRPISSKQRQIFEQFLADKPKSYQNMIIDSGCGRGRSTQILAQQNPQAYVLGIDKSEQRLPIAPVENLANCAYLRVNCIDFYLLAKECNLTFQRHYLLYPNPWPKAKQVQRRWHGHAIFPVMLALSQQIILRTNWKIYLDEFALAVQTISQRHLSIKQVNSTQPLTHFEAKYQQAAMPLWQLIVT